MSLPPTLELEDFLLELNQYAQTHDGNVSADLGQQLREYANQVRPSFRRFTSPFSFRVFLLSRAALYCCLGSALCSLVLWSTACVAHPPTSIRTILWWY